MKINDFEVLNTDYIFTSNTGSKVNSNCFRKLVVSTYAYNNISAQLVVGFLRYNNGCNFTTRWTNETGKLTGNTAINWIYTDVISVYKKYLAFK